MGLERRCLAFIFFILINIGQTSAQSAETPKTEKPIRVGTGFGYSFLGFREETDLPVNRELDTFNFSLNGSVEKSNFLYSFNFGLLKGEVDPIEVKSDNAFFAYNRKPSMFLRVFFENALDYRLWGNGIFPGYLGGAIRGDLYYSSLKESHYYSLTVLFSLDLHATQKWIINGRNELIFSASIPFFGYAFRPPYYGLYYAPLDLEERVTSFHNYRAVFCDLKYHHKQNDLLSFYLGLGFELSLVTFPQTRKDASFSINAGITFSF
ncbi:hypothetical protein [Treponema sp. R6D11]